MPAVQRLGDQDNAGGQITQGDSSVLVNGKPIAVPNTSVTAHGKGIHGHAQTQSSKNTTVFVNGQPALVATDVDSCGHVRVGGSPDVSI